MLRGLWPYEVHSAIGPADVKEKIRGDIVEKCADKYLCELSYVYVNTRLRTL